MLVPHRRTRGRILLLAALLAVWLATVLAVWWQAPGPDEAAARPAAAAKSAAPSAPRRPASGTVHAAPPAAAQGASSGSPTAR